MKCPRCQSELRAIAGYQCLYKHTWTAPNYPFAGDDATYSVEPVLHITGLLYQCANCGLVPIKYHLDLETAARLGLTADRRGAEHESALLSAFGE